MSALQRFIAVELAQPVDADIAAAARQLADRLGGEAVLFYGSILRTGDLSGVLDFYVLGTEAKSGFAGRHLWPDVSYHERDIGGRTLRAKVAAMPLDTFERAAAGQTFDTTIWARFVQPSALIWARSETVAARVVAAVAAAAETAAAFAALHGPRSGQADAYWRALFRATYATEFRVERPGREDQILAHARQRYRHLLPLAWASNGLGFRADGDVLTPDLRADERRRLAHAWTRRRRLGKPLNLARLVKAAGTFDGAARYGLWKVERHTGVKVPLTPWRERHPILAAPSVLFRVWRARRGA